ncbi:MAG TPA: response regulator [Candidatus Polarisedimenticolia bacterium]|nr:response regulator [Candidatus Polarisedimenticolia bacterium]
MYKILLADDVKLTLATEKAYLEGRNLKVFATSTAAEVRELTGVVQPDLVVLDYEMPDMDGAEVCRQIKENTQTAHIPVLILSVRDDDQIVRRCLEAGAAGFVRKTDGREALLEEVARTLGVPRRRHVRVGCRFSVGIGDDGRLFTGAVENISQSGMFLTTDHRFSVGMALRLRFDLPGVDKEIRLLGEVVRSEELTGESFGYGLQFLEIAGDARDGLQQFLENSL